MDHDALASRTASRSEPSWIMMPLRVGIGHIHEGPCVLSGSPSIVTSIDHHHLLILLRVAS